MATSLIHHMTGGQRQVVAVDEEFNILVDGQEINTLSGSGKAVANLALRLGLGQVLTNNVLSLFTGDEIDASMDANRAKNTSGVLHALKDQVNQILLVSRKYSMAEYYITVGDGGYFTQIALWRRADRRRPSRPVLLGPRFQAGMENGNRAYGFRFGMLSATEN